eukprot:4715584-Prymnesium_polylepis.1
MCRSHDSSGSCRRASRQRAVRHTTFHGARTGARDLTRAGGGVSNSVGGCLLRPLCAVGARGGSCKSAWAITPP